MKILVKTRQFLQFSGYMPFEHRQRFSIQCAQLLLLFGVPLLTTISLSISAVNANTFRDLSDAFGALSEAVAIVGAFGAFTWKKAKVIEIFGDIEGMINRRIKKSLAIKTIYQTANADIEQSTQRISSRASLFLCLLFLIYTILSAVIYLFGENNSADSLQLVMPMAYVILYRI